MRKALAIGINDYKNTPLSGCVSDAERVHSLLWRNDDHQLNVQSRLWTAPASQAGMAKGPPFPLEITRSSLRKVLEEFFEGTGELAIFFFAGHGYLNKKFGGYLVTQDAVARDEGVAMLDLLTLANKSKIKEIVIILDCCYSGAMAQDRDAEGISNLREGVTILSASGPTEVSREEGGHGVFSNLVCDAMEGGAADVQGKVSVANIYAYADEALGAFEQRPFFKSSISKLATLRRCQPAVPLEVLQLLPVYFPTPLYVYPLDPSYEPEAEPKHEEHEKIFGHLQNLRDARLVVPVGEKHLYHAAMHSKACKLTPLGRSYWRLAHEAKL